MKFKSPGLEDEFNKSIPVELQVMVHWFDQLSSIHFGKEAICTRVLENICGDSGVHEIGHAVDCRCEYDNQMYYSPEQQRFLASEMNKRFPRADNKLSCIFHSFQGGPLHAHIQIRPGITKNLGKQDASKATS